MVLKLRKITLYIDYWRDGEENIIGPLEYLHNINEIIDNIDVY